MGFGGCNVIFILSYGTCMLSVYIGIVRYIRSHSSMKILWYYTRAATNSSFI